MTKKSVGESVVHLNPSPVQGISGETRVKWHFGAQKSAAVTFTFCQINNEGDYRYLEGWHTSKTKHRKIIKRATMTVTCQITLVPQTLGWALIFDRPPSKYTAIRLKSHGLLVHRLQKKHVTIHNWILMSFVMATSHGELKQSVWLLISHSTTNITCILPPPLTLVSHMYGISVA